MRLNLRPSGLSLLVLLALTGCGGGSVVLQGPSTSDEAAPQPAACPAEVPTDAKCLSGRDSKGAFYMIAMPAKWSGTLVMHAHGGPDLQAPDLARSQEDLTRWSIMVKAGYAWAGSSYRQGGVEVRAAAEDTERLRGIFRKHVAKPTRTILHGQSWGAGVAAKGAEMFTEDTVGERPYDGVLLTSGVLGGGTRSYDFRLDLRVVYQYLCGNHPRPTEPQYALNLGLPADVTMKQADVALRVNECLALNKPAAERTAAQSAKIKTIVDVIKIPESAIQSHMNWSTMHFQDISAKRTGGASPFGNEGAVYSGSGDDVALNAGVLRYKADTSAYQKFATDSDPVGKIPVPVLSTKWISDPTAFVELDSRFRDVMRQGGSSDRLVQTFTTKGTHSFISDPTYPTLMTALLRWVDAGVKPTPADIAKACPGFEAQFGTGCVFNADYTSPALETRVPARQRPQ
ncbi:hypothetical protein [Diaphorobacter aerolatus]|uniref:Alpha/beta hydrolase n=1 Tax=Diaphorobacter aerolatus TaxID=1288495 RepID=A0A7H0GLH5_9BURK|nr:hypothetical protein [Diaphorobacter aerolatus]QNP49141.1 hypothetical protein H9K75_03100 [Diaphorobacter aerolatus]